MSFHEGSQWQEQNEIRKENAKNESNKKVTPDEYCMTNAGLSVEKVTHFATDDILYLLITSVKGVRLSVKIDKQQFENYINIGVNAYHNDYHPEKLHTVTKINPQSLTSNTQK